MNIYADETIDTTPSVDGGVVTEDITNELNINKLTSGSLSGYTQINFPATGVDNGEKRLFVSISLTDFIKLNSEHEYTLSYNWVYNVDLTASMNCALRFYDNEGNLLKEQILVAQAGSGSSKNHLVDISFVPDTTDIISGYKCELLIYFLQSGYNSNNVQRLYISDISLIDNDDDSGWFQKILDAIKAIPNNIKSFFTNLGDRISGFFDELGVKFDNMKESVVNAFVTLKDDLLGGLESLFIPTDDYFDRKSDEMQQWGADHFGFLWELSDLLISTVQNLKGLLQDGYVFILPAAEFDLNGEHYVLWDEYEVPVAEYIESVAALKYAYNTYLIVISGICGVALFNYARKTFDKVTAN